MSLKHSLIFWIIGLVVVGAWIGASAFSREARLERRRRKSHTRLISKTNRPSVRFSVRLPGSKKGKTRQNSKD